MVRFRPEAPYLREWLSGRASPCQGERREFESRLPLQFLLQKVHTIVFAPFVLKIHIWYHGQVVRQRSATPLFPGSNPGGTSKNRQGSDLNLVCFTYCLFIKKPCRFLVSIIWIIRRN